MRVTRPGAVGVTLAAAIVIAAAGSARADRTVLVAGMSTLGQEADAGATRRTIEQIEAAIAKLPATQVVTTAQVRQALRKLGRPQPETCSEDVACQAELGTLVGASLVVSGEVGGLGASTVFYLTLTDVVARRELRSTTLTIGGKDADTPEAAAVRLLDPDRYVGAVTFAFDVAGATVLIDGSPVPLPATKRLELTVGTHAVTVTHPQYRNFVKFVNVEFGATTTVEVAMKQYPIVEHELRGTPAPRERIVYVDVDVPLWRRPYVAGTAIAVLAVVAGIVASRRDDAGIATCRALGLDGCAGR